MNHPSFLLGVRPTTKGRILRILRLPAVGFLVASFLILQTLRQLLPGRLSLRIGLRIAQTWSKMLVRILGIKIRHTGRPDPKAGMIVSNHVSWLDPVLTTSKRPALFITSNAVKTHPFLGRITRLACCRFVSRNAQKLHQELLELGKDLGQGNSLAFYPEATTGDGTELLPFKPALFELSSSMQIPFQCVAIEYLALDRMPITANNKHRVFYYGDILFSHSLWNVLANTSTIVQIHWGQTIKPQDKDRKTLCQSAEKEIRWLMGQKK